MKSVHSAMPASLIVLLLALLLGIQPVTTDLYLPALPGLTQDLAAPMAQAQLTLTGLLLAFGLSQLVWGPVSDRYGRRPVLLGGMACYTLASIGSALAPSMQALILWRCLQGAAMGAGVMAARAIIRDLYSPQAGAQVMARGLSGLGLIACMSPPLGSWLTAHYGWHAALMALAVFGALTLALLAWKFEETIPQRNLQALQPAGLVRSWRSIVAHPTFLAYSALAACSYAGLFTYLATSSFVFIRVLGLSTTQYGLVMLLNSTVYLSGTFVCRRLIYRVGLRRTVAIAGVFSCVGGTALGLGALAGISAAWAIMLPMCFFTFGHGMHQPCGQSGAVAPFPQAAGAASALNGFAMTATAFVTGQWLGTHMDGSVMPLALGIWFWSSLIALCAWTLVQRHGQH
jgi:DHA1 family bicyclomycin/chloramphenicol resistance-like MFS transporter